MTFAVRPNVQEPSTAHLIRSLPSPLIVLTSTPSVHAVLQLLARDMAILAVRDHVLLWDAAVVHTLPRQDRFA